MRLSRWKTCKISHNATKLVDDGPCVVEIKRIVLSFRKTTWPKDHGFMGRISLPSLVNHHQMVSHHPAQFSDYRHCCGIDIMFLTVEELHSTCLVLPSLFSLILTHTRNFRLTEHFSRNHFPVCPTKLGRYWSYASKVTICETVKNIFHSIQKHWWEVEEKERQLQSLLSYMQKQ